MSDQEIRNSLQTVLAHISNRDASLHSLPTLPTPADITATLRSLPASLPDNGLGTSSTITHLLENILPGILQAQNGPRYFGFVIGGVDPAAQLADILATSYDENVQVNLGEETASVAIEQRVLELVLDLLQIERDTFMGRTITTGATASNMLGLACARNHLYSTSSTLPPNYSFSQDGPPPTPFPIKILALHPHFSISKAASFIGLGGGPAVIQSVPAQEGNEVAFDLEKLEERLKAESVPGEKGVIVVYGVGEVNTGAFGGDLGGVARLCREYGAWLHVDAAFGGFAGLMPQLRKFTQAMDQADSLTLDAHKWLQAPYDAGLFYTRHTSSLTSVFQPPSSSAPAYLSGQASSANQEGDALIAGTVTGGDIPSPLFVGIENSRRFRALPLLASLLSLGRDGYEEIITRNILFARKVAEYINASPHYTLFNTTPSSPSASSQPIIPSNIVLFTHNSLPAPTLTSKINGSRKMYVSKTVWRGQGAVRLAVSNWRTGIEGKGDGDWEIVKGVLESVGAGEGV
ncbi:hypothetical protein B9479_006735 [Cryptococcus floricola]|uniref:PLP-dependent transferase n=1 Tax=Cryptococcus floricola TaxID=2591691 RepID=A0A5D3AR84_9TREE|nr:hypothetical protein B9479_006735 [Cryptococcus floricola]